MLKAQNNIEQIYKESALIVGVDEVGRGCIAGPVCAGVVVFKDKNHPNNLQYKDSKLIPEPKRELLYNDITENHYCGIGWASVEEIDKINIRQAALLAMKRALSELEKRVSGVFNLREGLILVDGKDVIPNLDGFDQLSVIKGDQKIREISAASIIAKVSRDRLMKALASTWGAYKFEQHKGYGTAEHREAIKLYGITEHHRKTFGGVKEYL